MTLCLNIVILGAKWKSKLLFNSRVFLASFIVSWINVRMTMLIVDNSLKPLKNNSEKVCSLYRGRNLTVIWFGSNQQIFPNYGLFQKLVYVPKRVKDSNSWYMRKWKTLNCFKNGMCFQWNRMIPNSFNFRKEVNSVICSSSHAFETIEGFLLSHISRIQILDAFWNINKLLNNP